MQSAFNCQELLEERIVVVYFVGFWCGVCVCVLCTCMYMCIHVYMCVLVHVHPEAQSLHQMSSSIMFDLIYWGLAESRAHSLGYSGSFVNSRDYLFCLLCTGITKKPPCSHLLVLCTGRYNHTHLTFTWVLGNPVLTEPSTHTWW